MQQALADLKPLYKELERLNQLSAELKIALANDDPEIFSKDSLKRTDEIEKLAKHPCANEKSGIADAVSGELLEIESDLCKGTAGRFTTCQ